MQKMEYIGKRRKPCSICPYTLGLIQTLINPCPQCRENGYQTYEHFKELEKPMKKKLQ